jgi:hypothetical protein
MPSPTHGSHVDARLTRQPPARVVPRRLCQRGIVVRVRVCSAPPWRLFLRMVRVIVYRLEEV